MIDRVFRLRATIAAWLSDLNVEEREIRTRQNEPTSEVPFPVLSILIPTRAAGRAFRIAERLVETGWPEDVQFVIEAEDAELPPREPPAVDVLFDVFYTGRESASREETAEQSDRPGVRAIVDALGLRDEGPRFMDPEHVRGCVERLQRELRNRDGVFQQHDWRRLVDLVRTERDVRLVMTAFEWSEDSHAWGRVLGLEDYPDGSADEGAEGSEER